MERVRQAQRRVRRMFPRSGRAYELFDCSVFLLILGAIGYVFTEPPPNTRASLSAPLLILTETELGILLTLAAVLGIVSSYITTWIRAGYIATITMSLIMSMNFFIGFAVGGGSVRTLISVAIYGWLARRLIEGTNLK